MKKSVAMVWTGVGLAAVILTSCTNTAPPTPAPSPTGFVTPTSGDWQTAPPDYGTPTTAPEASTIPPPPSNYGSTLAPGKAGTPRGQKIGDTEVDRSKADAVATAFAARLNEMDSRIDNRPNDSTARAVVFTTAALKTKMTSGAPVGGVGAFFLALQQNDGYTVVSTELGGLAQNPPDTPTTAVRVATCTVTGRNDTGWTSEPETSTYLISLTKTGQTWTVDDYRQV